MLLPIIGVIAIAIVALLGYAASRPDSFRVQRSTRIAAPPQQIVPHIDDFRAWSTWSPYEKLDPAMKKTYSGAPRGVGAVYEWNGNAKSGQGRMEIRSSDASAVAIALDFTRPFRANNLAEFTLVPDGGATTVTWSMTGSSPFVTKLFGVFVNMDDLIGRDFVTGLASLKAASEQAASPAV
jgi:polyketide cyclase/dehydrase/lipid transport protein